MIHLKTYENFQIGDHVYILVSSDKQWYVSNSAVSKLNFRLESISNLTLEELDKLKRLNIQFSSSKEAEQHAMGFKETAQKFYVKGRIDEDSYGLDAHYGWYGTKSLFQRMHGVATGLPASKTVKGILYDDEKFYDIVNDLIPMRIFIGAYEDEKGDDPLI